MEKFTLDGIKQIEVFDPQKHLGAWIELDEETRGSVKAKLDLPKNSHLLNKAVLLNLPVTEVESDDWEKKLQPLSDYLKKVAKQTSSVGEIGISTFRLSREGNGEKLKQAGVLKVFSIGNGVESDNVLMMTFVQILKGDAMLDGSKYLPPYPTGDRALSAPLFTEIFPTN